MCRRSFRLTGAEMAFPYVVQHLLALAFQALDWKHGPFEAGYPYHCSEESKVTLQQEKFSKLRTFRCADGINRLFSWHSKIHGEPPWRIHFIPDAKPRRVLIGYVGPHLRTDSDPH